MSLVMSNYPNSQKSTGASRQSLPVARGVDGGELDALRTVRPASSSETRLQAGVGAESSDPYADPPCTD